MAPLEDRTNRPLDKQDALPKQDAYTRRKGTGRVTTKRPFELVPLSEANPEDSENEWEQQSAKRLKAAEQGEKERTDNEKQETAEIEDEGDERKFVRFFSSHNAWFTPRIVMPLLSFCIIT